MPLKGYKSPLNYDVPSEHWRKIGPDYINMIDSHDIDYEFQERMINDQILKQYSMHHGPKFVLELGAGFGRITKILLNKFPEIELYDAVDCSQEQLANLSKYLYNHGLYSVMDKLVCHIEDIISPIFIDFVNERYHKYDLIVASEFLMHVPEANIISVIENMDKLLSTGGIIFNIDWSDSSDKFKGSIECFKHDYKKIFEERNFKVVEKKLPAINQSIFISKK